MDIITTSELAKYCWLLLLSWTFLSHLYSVFCYLELSFLREGMFCCPLKIPVIRVIFFCPLGYFPLFTDNLTSIKVFQNYNLKEPCVDIPSRTNDNSWFEKNLHSCPKFIVGSSELNEQPALSPVWQHKCTYQPGFSLVTMWPSS